MGILGMYKRGFVSNRSQYVTNHSTYPLAYPYISFPHNITLVSTGRYDFSMPSPLVWIGCSWCRSPLLVGEGSTTTLLSPLLFVVHMKEEEESTFVEFLHRPQNAILCSPRVTLLAYISRNNSFFHSNYPINILRNIGIRHTRTSHFLVLDTDMWVSQTSYEMLMKIPDSIWESPQIAVVIPAFFSLQWNLPQLPLEQQILS